MDFQITALAFESLFIGSVVMDVSAKWISFYISYVVSSRSDFIVGTFIAGTSENIKIIINLLVEVPTTQK